MKKAAILTYTHSDNYGALLQAYALKEALALSGVEAKALNYRVLPVKLNFKMFIKKILFSYFNNKYKKKFENFRKLILENAPALGKDDLPPLNERFEVFITGSDQVWNFHGNGFDTAFMLDFVQDVNKKYSYAASFGRNDLPDSEKALAAPWLKQFKTISVREASAVPLAKELSGKEDVRADIDPTLLLSKEDWRKTAVMPKEKDFILLYLMSNNAAIIGFARDLARKTGLKLIMLSTSPVPYKGVKVVCPTPQEWLGYFLNAKYIVTNSFHGLAFSINFNKDFFVDLLPPPSMVNSRLENLLDLTGLRSRLISAGANLDTPAPDWAEVNAKLAAEKEKSFSYLRSMAE